MGSKIDQAIQEGRTVFTRTVKDAPAEPTLGKLGIPLHVLKWAQGNSKIGGWMEKGPWKGMPIFSLTLEERKTCPSTCPQWGRCYGDGMHMANRYKAGEGLEKALTKDIAALDERFPRGFVVRLHVLGDFYDVDYVKLWRVLMSKHPALRVYGYTHWQHGTVIGREISSWQKKNPGRVSILRSDKTGASDPLPGAYVVDHGSTEPIKGSVFCPHETGKVRSCGACGLCMLGRINITFIDHGRSVQNKKASERLSKRHAERRRELTVL